MSNIFVATTCESALRFRMPVKSIGSRTATDWFCKFFAVELYGGNLYNCDDVPVAFQCGRHKEMRIKSSKQRAAANALWRATGRFFRMLFPKKRHRASRLQGIGGALFPTLDSREEEL